MRPGHGHRDAPRRHCARAEPTAAGQGRPLPGHLSSCPSDSCAPLDPTKLGPDYGGLSKAQKHIRWGLVQAYLATSASSSSWGTARSCPGTAGLGVVRDYQIVAPPPTITMPQLAAGADVPQAQADAANAVGDSAAELIALDTAIAIARLRAQQAGQAGDLTWLSRQTDAYQGYQKLRGAALQQLATRLDALLTLTQGASVPDVVLTPADYATYLDELVTTGYDAETLSFFQALGRSGAEIEAQRQREIATRQSTAYFVTSFYQLVGEIRDAAQVRGTTLDPTMGCPPCRRRAATRQMRPVALTGHLCHRVCRRQSDGHAADGQPGCAPAATAARLELQLEPGFPLAGPGESTTVTLTVDVGHSVPEDHRRGSRSRGTSART